MADALIVNAETGEAERRPLTVAEQKRRQDDQAAAEAEALQPKPPTADERLAALETEVRGIRERAAAVTATGAAAAVRDAITGPAR